jgi:hypothetical protein
MLKAVFSAWPVNRRRDLVPDEQPGEKVNHKA